VQTEVAVLITCGSKDRKAANDSQRLRDQLPGEDINPPAPDAGAAPEAQQPARSVHLPGNSRLQGSAWLKLAGLRGERSIIRFLEDHLVEPELPWVQRRLE